MKKKKWLSMTLVSMLAFSSLLQAGASPGSAETAAKIRKSQLATNSRVNSLSVGVPPGKKIKSSLAERLQERKSGKTDQQEAVPGELIITYKKNATPEKISSLYKKYSLKKGQQFKSLNSEVVKFPSGKKMADYLKEMKGNPAVESVQPNYKYYSAGSDIAPNYDDQLWGLNNKGQAIKGTSGVPDIDIDAPESWSKFRNLKEVVVGVIDTGVDINHPDLKSRIWTNPGEIPGDGIDNDKNGFIDDVHGWDFYNNDGTVYDPLDGDEHGTHVSGTIAAALEGGSLATNTGVAGAAPNVKIMPIKFLGPMGGDTAGAIAAIEYAKKMGVKITNNSWGGGEYDPLLEEAISSCGCLFVAAAGNDGMDIDEGGAYPANFESPNILSVAALTNQGKLAWFSNYGKRSVDVAAPGSAILSTVPKFPIDEIKKVIGDFGAFVQVDGAESGFKAAVDGIGFEKLSGSERQSAFNKTMDYLLADKANSKVLIVQDDEHDLAEEFKGEPELEAYFQDFLPVYEDLLKNYGASFDTITVDSSSALEKSLGGQKLADYQAVIWFTGNGFGINTDDWRTLLDSDIAQLEAYLKTGGNLLLSGQDALLGLEDSKFLKSMLNLTVYPDMAPHMNAAGLPGSIFEGSEFKVSNEVMLFPSADFIKANKPNAKLALGYFSDYSQAYDYYSGTSMAAPHATGAAAMFAGLYPSMPPEFAKLYLSHQGVALPGLKGLAGTGKIVKSSKIDSFNDNTIPGLPLTKNIQPGSLDAASDKDDVFAVMLEEGEALNLALNGKAGTDFDLYVYHEESENVQNANGLVAFSENEGTSDEAIQFIAPVTGFYFVNVYAYKGKGDYKLAAGNFGGIYENESPVIGYQGEWDVSMEPDHSNSAASFLNSPGEAHFSFVGYSFEWQGFKDAKQGMAEVYIDGVKQKPVSLYSPSFKAKQSIFKKDFGSYGKHKVKIAWTGSNDPAGRKSAAGINVDRFIVKSNPIKPAVSYHKDKKLPVITWSAVKWTGLAAYHVYRKEASKPGFIKIGTTSSPSYEDRTAGAGKVYQYAVSVVVNGEETPMSSLSAAYQYDDDIKSSVPWKTSKPKGTLNVSLKDTHDVWKKRLEKGKTYEILLAGPSGSDFNLSVFKPGTSTIYGTKPAAIAATSKPSERIVFKAPATGDYYFVPSAKTGSGQYTLTMSVQVTQSVEIGSSLVKRTGKWEAKKFAKASGGSILQSNKAKSSAKYTFKGTGVSVLAMKDSASGFADIYLDGKKVKTVDLYSATRRYKQPIYTAKNLSNKSHTITIIVKEKKRKASKGKYAKIDVLKITKFVEAK